MKVESIIFLHFAEVILTLSKEDLIKIKQILQVEHLDTLLFRLYSKEELNTILLESIMNHTLPVLEIEGVRVQVDQMFISNLILKLEEKERLENKNRGRSIHL
jgi:hypothetical protein